MTSVSLHDETPVVRCAAADCDNPIVAASTGRRARYCSTACRVRAHRHRTALPAVAEVTMGSATSRGRHPGKAWMVQLRRSDNTVIIAIGHRRRDADRLAEQINELLA